MGPAALPRARAPSSTLLITSQDAYLDERTLESRLQYVARKMVQKPGSSQRQAQHSGAQQPQQQQQQAAVPSTDSSQTSAAAPGLANGTAPAPVSNGFAHGHGPGEATGSPFATPPMHQQQMHAPQRPGSASGWHGSGGQAANPMMGMGGHSAPPQAMSSMPMANGIAGLPAAQQPGASGLGGGLGGGMMPNGLNMGYMGGPPAGGGMGVGMGIMANGAPPGAMRNLHNPTSMNGTLGPTGSLGGSALMPDPMGPLGQLPKPENGMLAPKLEGALPGSSSGLGLGGSGHASPMAAQQQHQQQQVGMMQQYGAPPQQHQQPSAAQQYALHRQQQQQHSQPQQPQQQMMAPSQLPGYGMQQWQQQQQPPLQQQQAYSQPHQMASQDMCGMAQPSMAQQQQQQQQQQQRMGMGYGGAGAGILRGPAAGAAPSAGAVMSNGVPVLRNQRAAWSSSPTPGMMAVRRRLSLLLSQSHPRCGLGGRSAFTIPLVFSNLRGTWFDAVFMLCLSYVHRCGHAFPLTHDDRG